MFDKLVVSEPEKADQPSRRSYFMVSSSVVGILFITAVVISIFAADFSLGTSSFELSQIIAPPEMAAVKPEEKPSQPVAANNASRLPSRTENVLNIIENPIVPTSISTARSNAVARPLGDFTIAPFNSEPTAPSGTGRGQEPRADVVSGGLQQATAPVIDDETTPPPDRTSVRQISRGVVNGMAQHLPKPEYPAPARAVNAAGKVDVQVTISETGTVISAHAVSGHVLLRQSAENAARRARFTPTRLSDVPVKVTGVIVYNFVR